MDSLNGILRQQDMGEQIVNKIIVLILLLVGCSSPSGRTQRTEEPLLEPVPQSQDYRWMEKYSKPKCTDGKCGRKVI